MNFVRGLLSFILLSLPVAAACGGVDGVGAGGAGGGAVPVGSTCDAPIDIQDVGTSTNPVMVPFSFQQAGTTTPWKGCELDDSFQGPAVFFRWTADVSNDDFELGVVGAPGAGQVGMMFADSCDGLNGSICAWSADGDPFVLHASIEKGQTYIVRVVSKNATAPEGSFKLQLGKSPE